MMLWVSGSNREAFVWSTPLEAQDNVQRSEPSGVVSRMQWMKEQDAVVRLKVGRWS